MTVIAWDGQRIAADSLAVDGGLRRQATKIRRLGDGTVLCWSGTLASGLAVASWFERGADPDKYPAVQASDDWARLVVFVPVGATIVGNNLGVGVWTYENTPFPIPVNPPDAWGSGRDFALGAMAMTANASEAVEVAILFAVDCGGPVVSFDAPHRPL